MKRPKSSLRITSKSPPPTPQTGGPLKLQRKTPTLGRHGSGEPYRINPKGK